MLDHGLSSFRLRCHPSSLFPFPLASTSVLLTPHCCRQSAPFFLLCLAYSSTLLSRNPFCTVSDLLTSPSSSSDPLRDPDLDRSIRPYSATSPPPLPLSKLPTSIPKISLLLKLGNRKGALEYLSRTLQNPLPILLQLAHHHRPRLHRIARDHERLPI